MSPVLEYLDVFEGSIETVFMHTQISVGSDHSLLNPVGPGLVGVLSPRTNKYDGLGAYSNGSATAESFVFL